MAPPPQSCLLGTQLTLRAVLLCCCSTFVILSCKQEENLAGAPDSRDPVEWLLVNGTGSRKEQGYEGRHLGIYIFALLCDLGQVA